MFLLRIEFLSSSPQTVIQRRFLKYCVMNLERKYKEEVAAFFKEKLCTSPGRPRETTCSSSHNSRPQGQVESVTTVYEAGVFLAISDSFLNTMQNIKPFKLHVFLLSDGFLGLSYHCSFLSRFPASIALCECWKSTGVHQQQSLSSNEHKHALYVVLLLCFVLYVQRAIP
jgi:hypothetical protein